MVEADVLDDGVDPKGTERCHLGCKPSLEDAPGAVDAPPITASLCRLCGRRCRQRGRRACGRGRGGHAERPRTTTTESAPGLNADAAVLARAVDATEATQRRYLATCPQHRHCAGSTDSTAATAGASRGFAPHRAAAPTAPPRRTEKATTMPQTCRMASLLPTGSMLLPPGASPRHLPVKAERSSRAPIPKLKQ